MTPPASDEPPIASLIRTEASSGRDLAGEVYPSLTKTLHQTRWLSLQTLAYRHAHDDATTTRHWDMATRTTKREISSQVENADAVAVLAFLRLSDDLPRLLLVKQFRPPMASVTVELPAGLIEADESASKAALRELREETGFDAVVTRVHAPAPLSPGLSDETVCLVEVDVLPQAHPRQQLDSSENIHVLSVPVARLDDALRHLQDVEHVRVMHAVSTLAVGLSLSSRLRRPA